MLSVIIPALNEESAISQTIASIHSSLSDCKIVHEIIVINDGSSDHTGNIAESILHAPDGLVIHHPEPGGYGLSLKQGIKAARYDIIAITDADGTYPNEKLTELYKELTENGYDMVVGARSGPEYQGTFLKMPARRLFLWLSEYAAGRKIDDINSGLRVFRKELAIRHLHTIGNGFSFTTTITLAAFLNGYFVKYVPIDYYRRIGKSHIRYWRDSLRSLQIIVENILYYNPLKLFLLLVNAMISTGFLAFVVYILSDNMKIYTFSGILAAICLVSAFVISAIGLSADLHRISRKNSKIHDDSGRSFF